MNGFLRTLAALSEAAEGAGAATRSWYERRILPLLIDWACGQKEVAERRRFLVPRAHGRVLEIGLGTGLNLPFYDRTRVSRVVGLDPAEQMQPKALERAAGLPVELLAASAERVPAPDASFDTVVCTFSLCSIPDPLAALKEARRVLKPGGSLLFCEHGLAPDASVSRWQDRLDRLWPKVSGGCRLNRDVPALVRQAGFTIESLEKGYLRGPRPWTFHYMGRARR